MSREHHAGIIIDNFQHCSKSALVERNESSSARFNSRRQNQTTWSCSGGWRHSQRSESLIVMETHVAKKENRLEKKTLSWRATPKPCLQRTIIRVLNGPRAHFENHRTKLRTRKNVRHSRCTMSSTLSQAVHTETCSLVKDFPLNSSFHLLRLDTISSNALQHN